MPTCPHCGHVAGATADECPLCGTRLGEADADRPDRRGAEAREHGPGAPAGGGRGAPVPWEDPGTGLLPAFLRTWRQSLFEPADFFHRVAGGGTLARPLLYYLLVTVVGAFFSLVWQAVFPPLLELPARTGGELLLSFFITPFLSLLVLLVGGVGTHVAAVLVVRSPARGLGSTVRVLCYAAGPLCLSVVPFLGGLFALPWAFVLEVVGLEVVHRTNTGRALVVAMTPVALLVTAFFALVVAALLASDAGSVWTTPV